VQSESQAARFHTARVKTDRISVCTSGRFSPPNNDDIADSPYPLPRVQFGILRRLYLRHACVQQRGAAGFHFLEAARDGGGNVGWIADLFAIGAERFGDLGEVHLRRQL